MKELSEYRRKLMEHMLTISREFRTTCESVKDASAPIDAGWNVHQVAAHTHDVHQMVYGLRARRTVDEENPLFENFDQNAYNANHYDPSEPLSEILDDLASSISTFVDWMRVLPIEAWNRESRHETQGSGISMQR